MQFFEKALNEVTTADSQEDMLQVIRGVAYIAVIMTMAAIDNAPELMQISGDKQEAFIEAMLAEIARADETLPDTPDEFVARLREAVK